MRPARMWRRLRGALRSRWAEVRRRCTEALGAGRARYRSIKTSDRAQRWLDQVTVQVAATTTSAILIWMLTRGR